MASKAPSVLLIPGSFSAAATYAPIRHALVAAGVDIQVLQLPTVRLDNDDRPAPPMYDDAKLIIREIEKLADDGKDVIVISHSYGGVPLTQAVVGLGKPSRQRHGKQGGIVGLGFITSLVPAVGQSASEILIGDGTEETVGMGVDVSQMLQCHTRGQANNR